MFGVLYCWWWQIYIISTTICGGDDSVTWLGKRWFMYLKVLNVRNVGLWLLGRGQKLLVVRCCAIGILGWWLQKNIPARRSRDSQGLRKRAVAGFLCSCFFFWRCFFLRKSQFFDVSQGNSCESHKWEMGNFLVGSGCSDTSLAVSQIWAGGEGRQEDLCFGKFMLLLGKHHRLGEGWFRRCRWEFPSLRIL